MHIFVIPRYCTIADNNKCLIVHERYDVRQKLHARDTYQVLCDLVLSIIEVFPKLNSKSRCIRDTSIFPQTTTRQMCDGWSSRCKYNAGCIMQFDHRARRNMSFYVARNPISSLGTAAPRNGYFVRRQHIIAHHKQIRETKWVNFCDLYFYFAIFREIFPKQWIEFIL